MGAGARRNPRAHGVHQGVGGSEILHGHGILDAVDHRRQRRFFAGGQQAGLVAQELDLLGDDRVGRAQVERHDELREAAGGAACAHAAGFNRIGNVAESPAQRRLEQAQARAGGVGQGVGVYFHMHAAFERQAAQRRRLDRDHQRQFGRHRHQAAGQARQQGRRADGYQLGVQAQRRGRKPRGIIEIQLQVGQRREGRADADVGGVAGNGNVQQQLRLGGGCGQQQGEGEVLDQPGHADVPLWDVFQGGASAAPHAVLVVRWQAWPRLHESL